MKIAVDITPISHESTSGHKVRGVGMYISLLQESLVKYDKKNDYVFFNRNQKLPNDIDVVHYPYFDPFFFTLPILKKAKTIVTVHDLTPLVFPEQFPVGLKGKFRWEVQKLLLQRSDRIIADSSCSKVDIARLAGISPEKIDVVYLAANEMYRPRKLSLEKKKALLQKYNIPSEFILYVGDVTWNKNLPRLIRAVTDAKIPLVMIGKALTEQKDPHNAWNKDAVLVDKLTQQNPYTFKLGFLPTEDVADLYNLAKIFVMPSLYEGFGLPVIEAMACGTPVITSREGSLPEVVGDAAYFVDAYSQDKIEEAIEEVWKNSDLRSKLSQKGLRQAKNFSWKQTAEATIKVYEK